MMEQRPSPTDSSRSIWSTLSLKICYLQIVQNSIASFDSNLVRLLATIFYTDERRIVELTFKP